MEKDKRGGGEEGCKDICDRAVYWLANKIVNAAGVGQTNSTTQPISSHRHGRP
jgi:hypothetical protein